jgi:hypothetical protein
MRSMISAPCEAVGKEADAGGGDPGFSACDGGFEVLGEATVAAEPGKGAFHHPAPRLGLEGPDALGAGDDRDRPRAAVGNGIRPPVPA